MRTIISHSDLGYPTEPGEYVVAETRVEVDRHHLTMWQSDPEAVFATILLTRVGDRCHRVALGARHD